MSTDPNAPPASPIAPPMLSPDRKWVWDGVQWQPVADPGDPAHRSVFAAFNSVTQNLPVPVADARPIPGPPPMTVAAPVPLNVGRPKRPKMPAGPNLQLWDRAPVGLGRYLYYIAGGVAVLIVGVVAFQFLPSITLPSRDTGSQNTTTTGGLPPIKARSDFARSDRYVSAVLNPALADVNDTSRPIELGCHNAVVTVSCAAALPPMDRSLKKMLASMDAAKSTVPDCIAPNIARIRWDVAAMDTDLTGMQTASDQNDIANERKLFASYEVVRGWLGIELKNLSPAQNVYCDPTVSGP